jgi:hypothetical protein
MWHLLSATRAGGAHPARLLAFARGVRCLHAAAALARKERKGDAGIARP